MKFVQLQKPKSHNDIRLSQGYLFYKKQNNGKEKKSANKTENQPKSCHRTASQEKSEQSQKPTALLLDAAETHNSTNFSKSQPEDPVSQLKLSLATLAKHVEAMGAALGVPPRQQSPQLVELKQKLAELPIRKPEAVQQIQQKHDDYQRPDMTQEEKKAQRAVKAAEKKARADAAIAKKQADADGVVSKPYSVESVLTLLQEMSLEEKQTLKQANAAEKKTTKQLESAVPSTSKEEPVKNGLPAEEIAKLRPLPTGPPKKSAMKRNPHDANDDRQVKFGYSNEYSSEENLFVFDNSNIPPPSKNSPDIHPAFQKLYAKCEQEIIYEIDDLCKEFISAFKEWYADFLASRGQNSDKSNGSLGPDVKKALTVQLTFFTNDGKWPLPSGLGNIVSQMKREMNKMTEFTDAVKLSDWVSCKEREYFEDSYKSMATHLRQKFNKAKYLLLYNCNRVMEKVLTHCKEEKITVCVVDDRPNGRGFPFAQMLLEKGFKTEYCPLQGVASVMKKACLTVIGCSAVLSNGNVAAGKGAFQMCQMSQFFNIPAVFLVQSFKFIDKIHANNRMALLYREADEVVPSDMITALVTDIRIIPPSSAPAVLKAKSLDGLEA